MLDALEKDVDFLRAMRPALCMEIGSGSGCNITFLGQILRPWKPACLAVDINGYANRTTVATGKENGVEVEAMQASLLDGTRLQGKIDVLLFNPPYVPSEGPVPLLSEVAEDTEKALEAAWAGGYDGRHWIDMLLPQVRALLSPTGAFYMVVVDENKPAEIMRWAHDTLVLHAEILIDRRARNEHLSILKFTPII